MEKEEVCYTYETALEKAVEMERESHKAYKSAYFKISDPRVKAMIKDLVFKKMYQDEESHLSRLDELYESVFMPEM